jgi:hypothetical protein
MPHNITLANMGAVPIVIMAIFQSLASLQIAFGVANGSYVIKIACCKQERSIPIDSPQLSMNEIRNNRGIRIDNI